MKTRASRIGSALLVLAATAAVLAPFLVYVWGHVQIVTTGYHIEQIETRLKSLEQENRALRLEKARLEALPAIEERARKLGLAPLPPSRVLVVRARWASAPAPPPLPTPTSTPAPRAGSS